MSAKRFKPKKRAPNEEKFTDYLYPAPEINVGKGGKKKEGWLTVSEPGEEPQHQLHWAEYGNPKGDPVIVLHGGPGGDCNPVYARFFDPKHYRIILFDQRGGGQSKPPAETKNNDVWHLIDDINKLRTHLGIGEKEKAHLFGGSWGVTLALAYAIKHPDKVKSMTLRGLSLCRRVDDDFFYQGDAAFWDKPTGDPDRQRAMGVGRYFPEVWKDYVEFIPPEERGDMVAAYWKRMKGDCGPEAQKEAQIRWSVLEGATCKLTPDEGLRADFEKDEFARKLATLECLYFYRGAFSQGQEQRSSYDDNYILDNIGKIVNIPTEIVQGRYDMVCGRNQPDEFLTAWKKAQRDEKKQPKLHIIDDAGHSMTEPGISAKLVDITERFKYLGTDKHRGG